MFEELKQIPDAWRNALNTKGFISRFVLSWLFLVIAAIHNFHYLRIWQSRTGMQINDFILNILPPADLSLPIFAIEYSTVLLVLLFILPYPVRMMQGVQIFALVIFARTLCIYLVVLEPPKDMMPLMDPFANLFLHNKDVFVTKDLFFSGHISATVLLALISVNRYVKLWTAFAAIIIGILLLSQHTHYSMDILFAPIAAYLCYKLVFFLHRETSFGLELQSQK